MRWSPGPGHGGGCVGPVVVEEVGLDGEGEPEGGAGAGGHQHEGVPHRLGGRGPVAGGGEGMDTSGPGRGLDASAITYVYPGKLSTLGATKNNDVAVYNQLKKKLRCTKTIVRLNTTQ